MGKLSKVKQAIDKALDMRQAARMKRAEEMGFDTSNPVYHGTDANNLTEFKTGIPSKRYTSFTEQDVNSQGVFFAGNKEDAAEYGGNVGEYYINKGKHLKPTSEYNIHSAMTDKEKADLLTAYDDLEYILEPEITDGVIQTNNGLSTMDVDPDGNWIDYVTMDGLDWDYMDNPEVVSRIRERGYKSATVSEPGGINEFSSTFILEPKNIRSVNAAFDPAKKDSSNLLAGLGGAGILGASMLTPEQAAAADSFAAQDNDGIYADEFPTLDRIGTALNKLYLPIVGRPLEGTANYLQRLGEPRSKWDRAKDSAGAALDLL